MTPPSFWRLELCDCGCGDAHIMNRYTHSAIFDKSSKTLFVFHFVRRIK